MSSTQQSGNGVPVRETFPEVAAEIGEDPARFLDKPLAPPKIGDTTPMALTKARVDGIDKLVVVARWLEVEHKLERGPRESVVERLEQRGRQLKEHGERTLPDWSPEERREHAENLATESVAKWPDREGNERTASFVSGSPFSRERVTSGGDEQ